jgi:hypothetical protein
VKRFQNENARCSVRLARQPFRPQQYRPKAPSRRGSKFLV